MANLIEYLNGVKELEHFDPFDNDNFTYLGEINEILDNQNNIMEYFSTSGFKDISSMDDFIDYLCLKKIVSLEEHLNMIKTEDDCKKLENLIAFSKQFYDLVEKGIIIKFINLKYELLLSDLDDNKLFDVTYQFYKKYQNGINEEAFGYLFKNYAYKIFYDYDVFQKKIESSNMLFEQLFEPENVKQELESNFQDMLDVIVSMKIRKREDLIIKLKDVINIIDVYGEEVYKLINKDNVLYLERKVRMIFEFFSKIQDARANKFDEIRNNVAKILSEHISEKGHKRTYEIPAEQILEHLKAEKDGIKKLIMITHTIKRGKVVANLNKQPNKRVFTDMVSTNILTNDYYTLSHQDYLYVVKSVGSVAIEMLLLEENLFQESLTWYSQLINHLCSEMGCDNKALIDEFVLLHQMLQNIYWGSDKNNEVLQQSLCYGTATFICAYIEKLLRTVYVENKKHEEYISIDALTLGTLLSEKKQLIIDILGEYQLKHLRYFLLTDGKERIGYNLRNNLAHWSNIKTDDINRSLVSELMYLLTSVINSVVWYHVNEKNVRE